MANAIFTGMLGGLILLSFPFASIQFVSFAHSTKWSIMLPSSGSLVLISAYSVPNRLNGIITMASIKRLHAGCMLAHECLTLMVQAKDITTS